MHEIRRTGKDYGITCELLFIHDFMIISKGKQSNQLVLVLNAQQNNEIQIMQITII